MIIKTLGKYELLEEIGRGGFGTVYLARETMLEVERAVKVLNPVLVTDPDFITRFQKEAKYAARLEHANIVPVYDMGEADGSFYIAMKLMTGGSLKEKLKKQGALTFEQTLAITCQVADALEYACNQPEKLIHRDIKPGNILFDENGSVRLSDFGFAKALAGSGSDSVSTSRSMIGTPAYMAPEIWSGKTASPATDVYSLACVFYEMLTGNVLFKGDSPPEVMTRHMLEGPKFPAQWPQGVPDGMEAVLRKALAANASERYTTSGEMKAELLTILEKKSETVSTIEINENNQVQGADTASRDASKPELRKVVPQIKPPKSKKKTFWPWLLGSAGILLIMGILIACLVYIFPTIALMTILSLGSTETSTQTSTDLLAQIKQRGTIIVSTDPNYEPQSFLDTNGKRPSDSKCPSDTLTSAEMQGFDVSVAVEVGKRLGVETCFATPGWDMITAGNWADKWDISVGSMTIYVSRQEVLWFTTPYYYTPAVIATRTDSGINTIEDLAGKAVCAATATTFEDWLNGNISVNLPASSIYAQPPAGITVVSLPTDQECAQALNSGRKDFVAYVTSETVVNANIAASMPMKVVGKPVYSEDLAIAIDKAHTLPVDTLLKALDDIVVAMHADGTLTQLSNQWFGMDLTQDPK